MEDGVFHETPLGTPQGGVISPLLLNIALHGMEDALGIKYRRRGGLEGNRAVVRYADDFVVFCETQEDALQVVQTLSEWLKPRGLSLSAEKTRIVHLTEGFDFLGFNIRHYPAPGTSRSGFKLLIKPSKKSVTELRKRLRDTWLQLRGQNAQAIIKRLNPVIRGWANYFRTAVSARVFAKADAWMYRRAVRYVRHTHPRKTHDWCKRKYWGKLNPKRDDNWVFGDRHSGKHLLKFGWFPIVRHILVRGRASPDDPSLRDYWRGRQKVNARCLNPSDLRLAIAQGWVCRLCGAALLNGEELHRHHIKPKALGGSDSYNNRELVHLYCHQQRHAGSKPST
jgi:RNA-directed DNA polymerase